MNIAKFILSAIILFAPVPAIAQDWINYFDYEQRFSVNLPGEPTIEEASIVSQRGDSYPQRIYRANEGESSYVVKVIDYTSPPAELAEGAAVVDVRSAVAWEAWHYRVAARDAGGQITFDGYAQIDRIEGHQLQITNRDEKRLLRLQKPIKAIPSLQSICSGVAFTSWRQACPSALPARCCFRRHCKCWTRMVIAFVLRSMPMGKGQSRSVQRFVEAP